MKIGLSVLWISCCTLLTALAERPNVLVVLVDDLGFSDIGCYGSEIDTPNLDTLAGDGVRFSQFYNTAKCHSSRVSLLTGRYCIQAGDTSLKKAVTVAEMLKEAGYFTMMSGKWHLDQQPLAFGFERYFGHLSGSCNYYAGDNTFQLNGAPWKVPEEGFYTTVADVNFALSFLKEARQSKKPWFLYLAFNAPHAPLQPLEADYKKYLGRYDSGWDVMRDARLKKMKSLNLLGKEYEPSPRPEHIPAWQTMSADRQNWESRRMAAYAALIERVDTEMGRLIADLKKSGEFENTFILFVSDNGACPYDRHSIGMEKEPYLKSTSWSDSTGWAWARNAPFRFYKQNQFEGGISTPGIVHWPRGVKIKPGSIVRDPVHLIDILPTVAEITGSVIPAQWPGRKLAPVAGVSFAGLLEGKPLERKDPLHFLFAKDRALRDGDWKLVSFRSQPWELYNMADDRTELNNLAAKYPERVKTLADKWHRMSDEVLHVGAKMNRPVSDGAADKVNREWTDFHGKLKNRP